jgi:hypothetical protein
MVEGEAHGGAGALLALPAPEPASDAAGGGLSGRHATKPMLLLCRPAFELALPESGPTPSQACAHACPCLMCPLRHQSHFKQTYAPLLAGEGIARISAVSSGTKSSSKSGGTAKSTQVVGPGQHSSSKPLLAWNRPRTAGCCNIAARAALSAACLNAIAAAAQPLANPHPHAFGPPPDVDAGPGPSAPGGQRSAGCANPWSGHLLHRTARG